MFLSPFADNVATCAISSSSTSRLIDISAVRTASLALRIPFFMLTISDPAAFAFETSSITFAVSMEHVVVPSPTLSLH
ncbi:hypothetical protein ANAPH1_00754 [Anaplasma phagocytophilum]|nr:hypothetical protein ANAPH1_00754 [Anaplasma phagocytophilum]